MTIADVARPAGALHRRRVESAAQRLRRQRRDEPARPVVHGRAGYQPHAAARGLRRQSFTIGLLLDNIRNPFYGDFLDGVTDALAKTDFQVLVGSGGFTAQSQSRLADAMIDRAMDGLILVAPTMSRPQVIAVGKTIPAVVVGHHDTADEYDSVVDDDLAGAALVVDHLVALGHRRIAHTSATTKAGQWTHRPEHVRSEGYRQAMHRHGLADAVAIAGTSYAEEGGYQAGRELLSRPTGPRPSSRAPTSRPWASCARPTNWACGSRPTSRWSATTTPPSPPARPST